MSDELVDNLRPEAARISRLEEEHRELVEVVEELLVRHPGGHERSMCHNGLIDMDRCSTCSVVFKARAILEKVRK